MVTPSQGLPPVFPVVLYNGSQKWTAKADIFEMITRWIKRHLQRLGAGVNLDQLNSLVEDRDMLAENLENLVKKERLEGQQEGRQEGRREAELRALAEKRETVRNLLSFGVLSDEQIAEATGMALDEIVRLRLEGKH